MRKMMRRTEVKRTHAETAGLLAATLACYLAAAACVLALGYTLTTLAARDAGRRAAAVLATHGF
ncbi:MAG TPA: hypothetical protein VF588_05150 [Pyrinomonadaceae bacterium]|jgi:hypothetical protein